MTFTMEKNGIVHVLRLSGLVDLEVMKAAGSAVAEVRSALRLWVFENATVELSQEDIRAVSEHASQQKNVPRKIAIVAPSDLIYGLSRMYGVVRESAASNTLEIRPFRSEHEAMAWLLEQDE
ncbi:MAG: hypothetical protein ACE37D_12610 [Pseudomonadales bacterium]|jgi:uncharacterized linocin/CFP29 family protein